MFGNIRTPIALMFFPATRAQPIEAVPESSPRTVISSVVFILFPEKIESSQKIIAYANEITYTYLRVIEKRFSTSRSKTLIVAGSETCFQPYCPRASEKPQPITGVFYLKAFFIFYASSTWIITGFSPSWIGDFIKVTIMA